MLKANPIYARTSGQRVESSREDAGDGGEKRARTPALPITMPEQAPRAPEIHLNVPPWRLGLLAPLAQSSPRPPAEARGSGVDLGDEKLGLPLAGELVRVELEVVAAAADELLVVAVFDDAAAGDDEDAVGGANRREAV